MINLNKSKGWLNFLKFVCSITILLLLASPGGKAHGTVSINEIRIDQIQGAGHISEFENEFVLTTGIVTAVDSNGFYLQDPDGDGDDNTSDGIFVFTGSAPGVSVGDRLGVTGTVDEFIPGGASTNNLSITEIVSQTIEVESSSNPLPASVVLGAGGRIPPTEIIDNDDFDPFDPAEDGIDFYETLEGMRVIIQDAVAVSPTNGFGEIFTVVDNGKDATNLSKRGTINISLDDFNPERIQVQFDSGILPGFSVGANVGDRLGDVTGVVGYNFGNYEVNVTEPFNLTSAGLQQEKTKLKANKKKLTIASYNVLNLDPKVEEGGADMDDDVGNGRFDALANKIVHNLNLPDIIALQEVQDNNGAEMSEVTAADQTLQLLVDKVMESSGLLYLFIDNPFIGNETSGGQPGGNIRTAFLYNPSRVDVVLPVQTVTNPSDQQTNPGNPFFDSRLPLVVTFRFNNQEITVVNNHFSSKGGSSPLFGQIQPSVQLQEDPDVNGQVDIRRAQAETVKAFVDGLLGNNPDAHVVVLGDLNEFEFISPVNILEQSLVNLTETLKEDERYSFIFEGNSQSLDHILVSDSLLPSAQFDIVHVNSEFTETAQRASDHDPLVARIKLQR